MNLLLLISPCVVGILRLLLCSITKLVVKILLVLEFRLITKLIIGINLLVIIGRVVLIIITPFIVEICFHYWRWHQDLREGIWNNLVLVLGVRCLIASLTIFFISSHIYSLIVSQTVFLVPGYICCFL